jgi:hypothetical protein
MENTLEQYPLSTTSRSIRLILAKVYSRPDLAQFFQRVGCALCNVIPPPAPKREIML